MQRSNIRIVALSVVVAGVMVLPVRAAEPVDFSHEVVPILRTCTKCHSGPKKKGGLSIDTREAMLKGGKTGPAVVPGKPEKSEIIFAVTSDDPDERMPAEADPLSKQQIDTLRRWIAEGGKWEQGFAFAKQFHAAPLKPRRVSLPAKTDAAANPIDRLLVSYFEKHNVSPAAPVDDRTFARRVRLDLTGLLPTPAQLDGFVADTRADKRERLVDELLADRRAYADHWLTFWNDMLRNAYRGTGFIDNGRRQITGWLYASLYNNKPYNQFVHELISPVDGSEGFTKGIIWRGVVNASQRPEMQAAQNVGQVILGTNLKCASCHDSFVNQWKLKDSYALASVFGDKPLEIHHCDKPTGETSQVAFLYPELGTLDASAPRAQRMKQLADLVTSPDNGRLTRTIVNRLWTKLMGRGLVEPIDDMDAEPWNADVLDYLAMDLQEHGYDLKRTLRLIATSGAYQLPSVGAENVKDAAFTFTGPGVKRMNAEMYVDALSQLTDDWQTITGDMLKPDGRKQGGQLGAIAGVLQDNRPPAPVSRELAGRWVWSHDQAAKADPGGRIYLRRTIKLDRKPDTAAAVITCDNEFVLYVNGKRVAASEDWQTPTRVNLTKLLRKGDNVIAIEAANWPDKSTGKNLQFGPNPGGVIFSAAIDTLAIGTDKTWKLATERIDKWETPKFDDSAWSNAAELGGPNIGPWSAEARLAESLGGGSAAPSEVPGPIRAALAHDDPLQRALGRPNREQVVTRRDSVATTLQALELTNGDTLDKMLKHGAAEWLRRIDPKQPGDLITEIYAASLNRAPTDAERAAALAIVGAPATADGVADLLWTITMLPEFQLIY
ncbi:MAG: DUF1549 domain-containing protein [Phycisphaera sp.]|nr:DUF1549 domain-containing protein [Phycisphaera sp.]